MQPKAKSKTVGSVPLASAALLAVLGLPWPTWAAGEDGPPPAADLFVAADGDDAWSGRLAARSADGKDGPFATLERARDEIRRLKKDGRLPERPFAVEVRGGSYPRAAAFELTAEDSGREGAPIVYRARPGEQVRITGGRTVRGWSPVTDPKVLARLEEGARGKVLQADLRAAGVQGLGGVTSDRLEVFFKDAPMTLARWPNEGFVRIADIAVKDGHAIHGIQGSNVPKFIYDGDRPRRWIDEKDGWLHGYWFWDWSDQRQKIESIDAESRTIALVGPPHGYGYRKGQWYYALNLLSELDAPGEWYLDRETGTLYFYPPGPIEGDEVVASVATTLVTVRSAAHLSVEGFVLEAGRGTAVDVEGSAKVRLAECTLRNLGGMAARIHGGSACTVTGCEVHATGEGCIAVTGGDRKTLAPSGHLVEGNHLHHYGRWARMYTPAISLAGVGGRAARNLIHDAPHQAIAFSGNDHLIERNEIHHVCTESNDAGAIYSGRDWTWRGTVIRHNYFHDIQGFEGRGCVGVYLDDMLCGTVIEGNLFRAVTRAAFIGGGRDCRIENNIFVDCAPAVHVDARALGWASYHAQEWIREGREKKTLSGTDYSRPPYSERYPGLAGILEDDPAAPKGNVIARNICVGGRWADIEEAARPLLRLEGNLIGEDPGFVDAKGGDFRLADDSPALKAGFRPIPFEEIGLPGRKRGAER